MSICCCDALLWGVTWRVQRSCWEWVSFAWTSYQNFSYTAKVGRLTRHLVTIDEWFDFFLNRLVKSNGWVVSYSSKTRKNINDGRAIDGNHYATSSTRQTHLLYSEQAAWDRPVILSDKIKKTPKTWSPKISAWKRFFEEVVVKLFHTFRPVPIVLVRKKQWNI